MNLEKLFGNKVMRKMIFGKLEAFAREHKIRTIVIDLDENGIIKEPAFFNEETVTMTKPEFINLLKKS